MEWEEIVLDGLRTEENVFDIVMKAAEAAPLEIRKILKTFPKSMSHLSSTDIENLKSSKQGVILLLLRSYLILMGWEFFKDSLDKNMDSLKTVSEASITAAGLASALQEKELEADYLTKAGDALYDLHEFSQGAKAYKKALDIFRNLAQKDPSHASDVSMTLNNLGNLYYDTGDFSRAEQAYNESLRICRELAEKDPEHSEDIATTLNNLGGLYFETERFQQAEQASSEALKRYRELARKDPAYNSDVAMILNNLGHLYSKTNQFSRAKEVYTEAFTLRKTLAQKNPTYNLDVAQTLNDLGTLYSNMGDFSKAEEMYTEALTIRKDYVQENAVHALDVARTLNDLGNLYWEKKMFSQAEEVYVKAFKILKDLAEKEPYEYSPDIATTLNNLGHLYSDGGNFSKAEEMYTEALKIRKDLAKKNPDVYASDVAMTLDSLGNLYSDLGKFSESEQAYKKALKIYRELAEKTPDVYNPEVAGSLSNLGLLYYDSGKVQKAEELYTESLQIRRTLAEKNPEIYSFEVAATLNNMGLFYSKTKKFPQAAEAYTEALKLKRYLAKRYPDVYSSSFALTWYNLGNFYVEMGNPHLAEKAYSKALKIRKERALWIDLAKVYHALSLLSDTKSEDAVRLLELGILFSGEEKYKYAHKGGEEEIYLTFLEKTDDPLRGFGILEALRDSDLLSLEWGTKIEKAREDTDYQKILVKELLEKEVTPLKIHFQIPDNALFLYIQEMEKDVLYLMVTKERAQLFRGTSEFTDFGQKLLVNLRVQALGAVCKKDFCDIITKFDSYSTKWTNRLPSEIVRILSEKDIIVFSPDATFSYFPLECLVIDGEPICLSKKVIRATSMHKLQEITSRRLVTDSSLIIGNPWFPLDEYYLTYPHPLQIEIGHLKEAEKEAEMLAEKLPYPEVLLNTSATADKFLKELSNHTIIHFAGHGYLGRVLFFAGPMVRFPPEFEPEEVAELRKAWRLVDGNTKYMMDEWDIITDIDILDTPLKKGALVFLSACETGKHKYAGGGHFQGLAQSFLKSGASNVISSLIPLYGAPARDFAVSFYDNLLSGKSATTALLNTRKRIKEKYKAHIYWLPYIHYGPYMDSDLQEV